jgi:hypothetical protein
MSALVHYHIHLDVHGLGLRSQPITVPITLRLAVCGQSVRLVGETLDTHDQRTVPIEKPPLVGEVGGNFFG